MPRHTFSLPEETIKRVERAREDGESLSATVARLLEAGADVAEGLQVPSYVGIARGGPRDLALNDEKYLAEIFDEADPYD